MVKLHRSLRYSIVKAAIVSLSYSRVLRPSLIYIYLSLVYIDFLVEDVTNLYNRHKVVIEFIKRE